MQDIKKLLLEALDQCVHVQYNTGTLRNKIQNAISTTRNQPHKLTLSMQLNRTRLKDDPSDPKRHLQYLIQSVAIGLPEKTHTFARMLAALRPKQTVSVELLQQEIQIYKKISESKDTNTTTTFLQKQIFELTQQLQRQHDQITRLKSENVCLSFQNSKLETLSKQKDTSVAQMQRQLNGKIIQHNTLLDDMRQKEHLHQQQIDRLNSEAAERMAQIRQNHLDREQGLQTQISCMNNEITKLRQQNKLQSQQSISEKQQLTEQIETLRKDSCRVREMMQQDQKQLQKLRIDMDTKTQQMGQLKINYQEQLRQLKKQIKSLQQQVVHSGNALNNDSHSSDGVLATQDDESQLLYSVCNENKQLKQEMSAKEVQLQRLTKEMQVRNDQIKQQLSNRKTQELELQHLRRELNEIKRREEEQGQTNEALIISSQRAIIDRQSLEIRSLKQQVGQSASVQKVPSSVLETAEATSTIPPKPQSPQRQLSSPLLEDQTKTLSPMRHGRSGTATLRLNQENSYLLQENQRLRARVERLQEELQEEREKARAGKPKGKQRPAVAHGPPAQAQTQGVRVTGARILGQGGVPRVLEGLGGQ